MRTISDTSLETFQFGNKPEDKYYLLIDIVRSPDGVDITRLANADPRTFDSVLADMGCILMLSGDEVEELIRRGDIEKDLKHKSLFNLARAEGLI